MTKLLLGTALTLFLSTNILATPTTLPTDSAKTIPNYTEDTISIDTLTIPDSDLVLFDDPFIIPMYSSDEIRERLQKIKTSITLDYNTYVQSHIDLYTNNRRSSVQRFLGLGEYYFPIYEKALKEAGLPDELKYLSVIESALNPFAVSRVGATGLWQFMHATAKQYGLKMDYFVDERRDPHLATAAAIEYLKNSYELYGDWLLAIASYNCGTGNVNRAISRAGGSYNFWDIRPYLPTETRNYVPAFIAATYAMTYAAEHNIPSGDFDFSSLNDTILIDRYVSINQLSKVLDIPKQELVYLNPKYKKDVINGTKDNPMDIRLPIEKKELFVAYRDSLLNLPNFVLASYKPTYNYTEGGNTVHKVRSGETLSTIANRYKVNVQDIKVWNNLRSTKIVVGQRLTIRGRGATTQNTSATVSNGQYRVRKGDTLSTIAQKLPGVSVSDLLRLNKLKVSDKIYPGMLLKVNPKG